MVEVKRRYWNDTYDLVVREDDYLSVVEELNNTKSRLERVVESKNKTINQWRQIVEEKDEIIKGKNKDIDNILEEIKYKEAELNRKRKTITNIMKRLEELEDNNEELWTLKYIYDVDGVVKEYEQNGMLKEDAEELIGMDSDNWNHWSLTKEERPDKDKIIEGLLIRCESNEELIKELEEKIENLEIENRQLLNDRRLKIGLSDRRA
ncbi:hypothetical protein QCM11_6 [Bacillus phage QCM11]|uniref:Uncharacterized protein n=1 Tax=Bacillus phage QCM11 TaxID=1909400 RepID=A0A1I9S6M1_9CAUD|nr:hypothetical protein H3008_gp06 [Bacillus phage QCM11]AOZ62215.1 hypothetical protein QCM11_6 [Bacillus phage QCM11]